MLVDATFIGSHIWSTVAQLGCNQDAEQELAGFAGSVVQDCSARVVGRTIKAARLLKAALIAFCPSCSAILVREVRARTLMHGRLMSS